RHRVPSTTGRGRDMSRGYGRTQRALIAMFERRPDELFAIDDLVAAVYPEQTVTQVQRDYINAVMRKLAPTLGIKKYRSGRSGSGGWSWCYRVEGKCLATCK